MEVEEKYFTEGQAQVVAEVIHRYGVEFVAEACKKRIPEKPMTYGKRFTKYICPSCKYLIDELMRRPCCGNCGQHIDWSKVEE